MRETLVCLMLLVGCAEDGASLPEPSVDAGSADIAPSWSSQDSGADHWQDVDLSLITAASVDGDDPIRLHTAVWQRAGHAPCFRSATDERQCQRVDRGVSRQHQGERPVQGARGALRAWETELTVRSLQAAGAAAFQADLVASLTQALHLIADDREVDGVRKGRQTTLQLIFKAHRIEGFGGNDIESQARLTEQGTQKSVASASRGLLRDASRVGKADLGPFAFGECDGSLGRVSVRFDCQYDPFVDMAEVVDRGPLLLRLTQSRNGGDFTDPNLLS